MTLFGFSTIDTVFLILLGILTLRGFLRGFTGELFSIASLALGIIASVFFFKTGAEFLRARYFQGIALLPEILAFFAIFLIVFMAGKILEHIIKDIVDRLNLNKLDRALGLVLGLGESLALISLVLLLLLIQPFFNSGLLLDESVFARLLLSLAGVFRV